MQCKKNITLKSQSIAIDFLFDSNGDSKIVEISYGYAVDAYDKCTGFWDINLNWHNEKIDPTRWIIEDVIKNIETLQF